MRENVGVQPIIIIGMHRSGTTMITKMLEQLGVFVGKNLDPNYEPVFFIKLNDWLLRQAGGAWDHPEVIDDCLLGQEELCELIEDYLRYLLRCWPSAKFVGKKRYFFYETPMSMKGIWGWKDPRNTFTLPIWLRIFSGAKILHIYRNGVDVAASLRTRERRFLQKARAKHDLRKKYKIYSFFQKPKGFVGSIRCLDIQAGYELWESYISRVLQYHKTIQNEIMDIKYEDFLQSPREYLQQITNFCKIDAPIGLIAKVAQFAKPGRSFAYIRDKELISFYEAVRNRDLVRKLGY